MPAIVWKGSINFGLVSFPVKLFSAARAETVRFHMLHKKDLSRIKEVWYCAEEDKPIDKADIVKGHESGTKGEYTVVTDEELKKIAPKTASTMEILQFVSEDEVDPIYFERSYYVSPDNKIGKPYSLFMAALQATKQHAIAKIAMHNREHVVLIRPAETGLLLHTLFYEDELRKENREETTKAKYTDKELDLAKSLISHLTAPFKPDQFEDEYRANVVRLLEQKRKGQKITVVKQAPAAKVIDLMEALRLSLKASSSSSSATSRKTHASKGKRSAPAKRRVAKAA